MAANLPSDVPIVQRPPTRIVASGTVVLTASGTAGAILVIPGSNGRMDRLQFVVTNLDLANNVKLQTTPAGTNFATVFPEEAWDLESSSDFQISNPNAQSVSVEVCEIYADIGNLHGVPSRLAAAIGSGGTGAPSGGGGGGGTAGGGSSYTGGRSGGGGQLH